MKVQLLGTGSADGWPNAFCTCASCGVARECGDVRGQTGALIDDRLLIDCGPEIPAAANRHGVDLSGVRTLLFTHAHPDHVGPAALLFRHWARRDEPLEVFGPPAALEMVRHWIAPQDPVTLTVLTAGDRIDTGGYRVHALPATHGDVTIGEALLFDVQGPDGARVLYATDTGPLPDAAVQAVRDARFDIALIEETFGDHLSHDGDHLDLHTFPEQLRRLTEVGALTAASDVIAVHLSHHNPPTAQLSQRLAAWNARVVSDGTTISTTTSGPSGSARQPRPHRTLVLGGARSGKSRHAESLLASASRVTYLATAHPQPGDEEWQGRVAAHQARRPAHWVTVETTDVADALLKAKAGDSLLIDCMTLWLTQVMDDSDAWSGDMSGVDKQVEQLLDAWRMTAARVVAVSNEVGQGVVPCHRVRTSLSRHSGSPERGPGSGQRRRDHAHRWASGCAVKLCP